MNREIKFRAWDDFRKEMIYCDDKHYWALFNSPDSIGYGLYHRNDGHRLLSGEYNPPIMQFTGLHDKSGKEIYEGDIVTTFKLTSVGIGKIEYREDIASFIVNEFIEGGWDSIEIAIEVIGNIYEHPELIK